MSTKFRGIFAIPPTPFDDDLELDLGSFKSLIDFCCDSGAHGIVTPVNASEFTSLTDDERKTVVEVGTKQTNGRLPFVAGISGITSKSAVMFAKHAYDSGADALIAMPPYINKAGEGEIFRYYDAISTAAPLPIFIQNYIGPVGTPMSAAQMIKLVREIEHVDYIKEETDFAGQVITQCMDFAKELPEGKFKGIMGGKAGRYLLDEYRRGACGSMPACEVADVQAKIWNALEAGKEDEAAEMFNKIITLLNFEYQYGSALYKEVLKARGVIKTARFRHCGSPGLDSIDMIEFKRIMDYIKPMFKI
jgi:dihydrodipicolinate synthase/N-acetylneuraminate lyase